MSKRELDMDWSNNLDPDLHYFEGRMLEDLRTAEKDQDVTAMLSWLVSALLVIGTELRELNGQIRNLSAPEPGRHAK